jgi:hypothetical protein
MFPTEATVDPLSRGSRLDADHPENGVLIPCRFTAVRHSRAVQRLSSATRQAESRPGRIGSNKPRHEANGGAQCGKSARCVRRGGDWRRGTASAYTGAPVLDPTSWRKASDTPSRNRRYCLPRLKNRSTALRTPEGWRANSPRVPSDRGLVGHGSSGGSLLWSPLVAPSASTAMKTQRSQAAATSRPLGNR